MFRQMLTTEDVQLKWMPAHWLTKASVSERRILSAELIDAQERAYTVVAKHFIDGTYEGAGSGGEGALQGRSRRLRRVRRALCGIHSMNWHTGEQIVTPDIGEPSIAI